MESQEVELIKAVSKMTSAGTGRKGKSELFIEEKSPVMQDEKVLDMYHTPLTINHALRHLFRGYILC